MQARCTRSRKKPLPHMLCVTNMLLYTASRTRDFVRNDNTLARPYISYTQSDGVEIVLTNPPFGGKEEDGNREHFSVSFSVRKRRGSVF